MPAAQSVAALGVVGSTVRMHYNRSRVPGTHTQDGAVPGVAELASDRDRDACVLVSAAVAPWSADADADADADAGAPQVHGGAPGSPPSRGHGPRPPTQPPRLTRDTWSCAEG